MKQNVVLSNELIEVELRVKADVSRVRPSSERIRCLCITKELIIQAIKNCNYPKAN